MFKLSLRELFLFTTLAGMGTAWWLDHTAGQKMNAALADSLQESAREIRAAKFKAEVFEDDANYFHRLIGKIEERMAAHKKVAFFYPCMDRMYGRSLPTINDDED